VTTYGRFRVIEDHAASYPEPMVAVAGTRLEIDRSRSGFPGWVWGRDPDGMDAWVPEGYLEVHGAVVRLRVDYDSTELSVTAGEVVQVIEESGGWAWCRHPDGRTGWIPDRNLAPES
jgi:SH3-like domain-containing protein